MTYIQTKSDLFTVGRVVTHISGELCVISHIDVLWDTGKAAIITLGCTLLANISDTEPNPVDITGSYKSFKFEPKWGYIHMLYKGKISIYLGEVRVKKKDLGYFRSIKDKGRRQCSLERNVVYAHRAVWSWIPDADIARALFIKDELLTITELEAEILKRKATIKHLSAALPDKMIEILCTGSTHAN